MSQKLENYITCNKCGCWGSDKPTDIVLRNVHVICTECAEADARERARAIEQEINNWDMELGVAHLRSQIHLDNLINRLTEALLLPQSDPQ